MNRRYGRFVRSFVRSLGRPGFAARAVSTESFRLHALRTAPRTGHAGLAFGAAHSPDAVGLLSARRGGLPEPLISEIGRVRLRLPSLSSRPRRPSGRGSKYLAANAFSVGGVADEHAAHAWS